VFDTRLSYSSARLAHLRESAVLAKIAKYAVGSVVALLTSVVVFALMLNAGAGTTAASIGAFVAGALPNWVLNRRWAWQRTGRVHFGREVVGYVIVSLIALAASAAGTGAAQNWVRGHVNGELQVLLVTAVYVVVQAALFVAKYLVYERWIFAERSRIRAALRSRRHVWAMARANRMP
jgi:putative flippase GtrA